MAVAPDLCAAPNEGVGINHRAFANISADVHKHGRHANDSPPYVTPIANAGAAGNDADAVRRSDGADRISGLVEEGLLRGIDGHVGDGAHSKAKQNPFFHPGIHAPAGFRGWIRLRGTDFAAIQFFFELAKKPEMFLFVASGRFGKQPLNLRWQHEPSARVPAIPALPGCALDSPPSVARVANARPDRAAPSPPSRPSPEWDSTPRNLFP